MNVNHPSYYNRGKTEVWDFVAEQGLNFDLGSAVKYICRAGYKEPHDWEKDLRKAIEYITHEIKVRKQTQFETSEVSDA